MVEQSRLCYLLFRPRICGINANPESDRESDFSQKIAKGGKGLIGGNAPL